MWVLLVSAPMAETSPDQFSYCFGNDVNLEEVHQFLTILLLPKDNVELKDESHCLEVTASPERGKLFLKHLSKKYELKSDGANVISNRTKMKKAQDCRLDLKVTKKIKTTANNVKVDEKNSLKNSEVINGSVSIMELLLGAGKPGDIEVGDEKLKLICLLNENESAQLIFSHASPAINSQVTIQKGEWINLASIIKDLNEKSQTTQTNQVEINKASEKTEILYELQFK